MKRTTFNFVIDACSFCALSAMISSGLVLRYMLPRGSGRKESILLLWGFARHEWITFHFWAALVLIALLVVHLVLHWKWIVGIVTRASSPHSRARIILSLVILTVIVSAGISPFLSSVEKIPHHRSVGEGGERLRIAGRIHLRHNMTLEDIERETGTPVEVILRELGLPSNIAPDSHVGRLSRIYGFKLEQVHAIVDRFEESPDR